MLDAHDDRVASLAGYYTLFASSIERGKVAGPFRRNMPETIPIITLGRLAIDSRHERKGLGALLLRDAIKRTLAASQLVGVRLLVVHPIAPAVIPFYEQYGFRPITASSLTMGLPTESFARSA